MKEGRKEGYDGACYHEQEGRVGRYVRQHG